jgi:hypothetical protein
MAQLTPIDGQIGQDFVADPCHQGCVRRGGRPCAQGSNDFPQRFGDVQVDMPDFLIAPRGDLPHRLIKVLRIPPHLRMQ